VLDGDLNPLLIGFVEETAKILTILILVDNINYKYILNACSSARGRHRLCRL
jgi:hypothetical protein